MQRRRSRLFHTIVVLGCALSGAGGCSPPSAGSEDAASNQDVLDDGGAASDDAGVVSEDAGHPQHDGGDPSDLDDDGGDDSVSGDASTGGDDDGGNDAAHDGGHGGDTGADAGGDDGQVAHDAGTGHEAVDAGATPDAGGEDAGWHPTK